MKKHLKTTIKTTFDWLCHSPTPRRAAIIAFVLSWSTFAFCDDDIPTSVKAVAKANIVTNSIQQTGGNSRVKASISSLMIYFDNNGSFNLQDMSFPNPREVNITANDESNCEGTANDYEQPSYLSGKMPDNPVQFGPNGNSGHAMTIEMLGNSTEYSLFSQEVGLLSRDSRTMKIPILSYIGCPIVINQAKKLSVLTDLAFKDTHILNIISAKNNILQTTNSTPFYVELNNLKISGSAATAQNVIWRFVEKGISFAAGGVQYTASKEGAEIHFTQNGLALIDVEAH